MLIKKLYYSDYLKKEDDFFNNGELVQSFILGNIFVIAELKFYTSINSNNISVIKVTIETKEDVASGYTIERNLTNYEKEDIIESIKNFGIKQKYKLIYIYE